MELRFKPSNIVVERSGVNPRPQFHFEAKRLYRSDSLAEYVGDDGMGCFLSGKYAKDEPDAGMIGYIQSETPEVWAARLRCRLADASWTEHAFDASFSHSYRSAHLRAGRSFELFHVLLACNGDVASM